MTRKLSDITPEAIEHLIDSIDAPSTRRSAFIRISGLFSYAVRRGYIDRSPMKALDAPPDQAPRHRVLTDDELRKVLTVARMRRLAGDQYGAIVELLIYTGQRRHADRSARALDGGLRCRHDHLARRSHENRQAARHPHGPRGTSATRAADVSGLYFPSKIGKPFCGWSYHFRKLCAEVGFSDWVIHDLRRTMATRWQEAGIEIATTEKMLGHSAITGGLVGIYQRSSYLAQMRQAVEKWESFLTNLCAATR